MNNQFDELTKSLAQSVTRRAALKRFRIGLVGMALACIGLASRATADPKPTGPCLGFSAPCQRGSDCCSGKCVNTKKGSFFSGRVCAG